MEQYRDKYIEFILKTKGVSWEYSRISKGHIDKLLKFLQEKQINDINSVDRLVLYDYQEMIMKTQNLATVSKHGVLMATALFFQFLYDYEYIKDNPGLIIEYPKLGSRIPKDIMNEKEISFLLNLPNKSNLIGLRDFCIMSLLYSSAMRTKELFNLKLEDIDFKRNQVLVKRPKNKRDRIMHIDSFTATYIRKYIQKVRPWLLKNKSSEHLFISATGTNLNRNSFAAHFSGKYAPIMRNKFNKNITPYCFRHTSATHWMDSGARQRKDVLPYVQRQLGHESLESTAIYTHVAIEPLRQMFKQYHPREKQFKHMNKIPSPADLINKWHKKKNNPSL